MTWSQMTKSLSLSAGKFCEYTSGHVTPTSINYMHWYTSHNNVGLFLTGLMTLPPTLLYKILDAKAFMETGELFSLTCHWDCSHLASPGCDFFLPGSNVIASRPSRTWKMGQLASWWPQMSPPEAWIFVISRENPSLSLPHWQHFLLSSLK